MFGSEASGVRAQNLLTVKAIQVTLQNLYSCRMMICIRLRNAKNFAQSRFPIWLEETKVFTSFALQMKIQVCNSLPLEKEGRSLTCQVFCTLLTSLLLNNLQSFWSSNLGSGLEFCVHAVHCACAYRCSVSDHVIKARTNESSTHNRTIKFLCMSDAGTQIHDFGQETQTSHFTTGLIMGKLFFFPNSQQFRQFALKAARTGRNSWGHERSAPWREGTLPV